MSSAPAMPRHRPAVVRSAPLWIASAGAFACQVVAVPSAASMFRTPKLAVALGTLATATAVALWIRWVRSRELVLVTSPLGAVLGMLPLLQLASASWSAEPAVAAAAAASSAVWVCAVFWLTGVGDGGRRLVVMAAGWGAGVSAVVMALQRTGLDLPWLPGAAVSADRGAPGLAGNPSDAAMAAGLMLPLVLYCGGASSGRRRTWILPALLVLAVVLSGSLAGFAALALLAAAVFVAPGFNRRRVAAAAVAALAVTLVLTATSVRARDRLQALLGGDVAGALSGRADGWSAAAQMAVDRPWLGAGAGQYAHWFYPSRLTWLEQRGEVGSRGELATHFEWAHNDPLQLVAELGLVGAVWLTACACTLAGRGALRLPLARAMAAVALPFLLTHYPTHVAVGLIPLGLAAAALLERSRGRAVLLPRVAGIGLTVTVSVGCLAALVWQGEVVAASLWRSRAEARLAAATTLAGPARRQAARKVAFEAVARSRRHPASAHWQLRLAGRALLLAERPGRAERAFRAAYTARPHEEAEFGLAMALSAQGRQAAAVPHLRRVCRVNPVLLEVIPDPDLRRAVASGLPAR